MRTVNIHEAEAQLSKLVDRAVKGEPFIIAKAGKPLVKVTALEARLPAQAADLISNEENEVYFSPASIWEIAIKQIKAPELVPISVRHLRRRLLENGSRELAITGEHALATAELPAIHADPFDRILIAQATVEGITLLTSDRLVAQYPGPILSV